MRALLLLLAAIAPALAQEAVRTLPVRDVAVAYHVEGAAADAIPGGISGLLHLAWDAAGQRLRVESDGRPQALLVDLGGRSAELIDRGLHTAITIRVRERDLEPVLLQEARLVRRGTAVVAGVACTDFAVTSARGAGTVCLTADGVALRAAGTVDGKSGRFTAVSVQYGPQPAGLFRVPAGYFQLTWPGSAR